MTSSTRYRYLAPACSAQPVSMAVRLAFKPRSPCVRSALGGTTNTWPGGTKPSNTTGTGSSTPNSRQASVMAATAGCCKAGMSCAASKANTSCALPNA